MWPGYGQNMRVLKWMFERTEGKAQAMQTVLGAMPRYEDLDWSGMDFTPEQFAKVMETNPEAWEKEIASHKDFFLKFQERLPVEFVNQQEDKFIKVKAQQQEYTVQ